MYHIIECRSSWDARLNILNFPEAHQEIIFWGRNITSLNSKQIQTTNTHRTIIFSGASALGIGAVSSNSLKAHRNLNDNEKLECPTYRELAAALFAIQSFLPYLQSSRITFKS